MFRYWTASFNVFFPKTMDVAVLIHGYRLVLAYAENGFSRTVRREILHLPAVLRFQINESYMMLFCHRMRLCADFDFDSAVVQAFHDGDMFFHQHVRCSRLKFDHFFSAANHIDTAVDCFDDNVSARCAQVEFCCHNLDKFNVLLSSPLSLSGSFDYDSRFDNTKIETG